VQRALGTTCTQSESASNYPPCTSARGPVAPKPCVTRSRCM
jgi:hypothetical protein